MTGGTRTILSGAGIQMVLPQHGVIMLKGSFSHSELGHDPDARGVVEFQTVVG